MSDDVFLGSMFEQGLHKYSWTHEEISAIKRWVADAKTNKGKYFSVLDDPIGLDPGNKRRQSKFNPNEDPGKNIQKIIYTNIRKQVPETCHVRVRDVVLLHSEAMSEDEMKKKGPQKLHMDGDDEKRGPKYGFSIMLNIDEQKKPAFLRVVPGSHNMTKAERLEALDEKSWQRLLRIEWYEAVLWYRLTLHGGWMYLLPHERLHANVDIFPKDKSILRRSPLNDARYFGLMVKEPDNWGPYSMQEIKPMFQEETASKGTLCN